MSYLVAFVVGGGLAVVAQAIAMGFPRLTPGHILVGFTVAGAVLNGVGLYDQFIRIAGAGALIPVSGFGAAITKGILQETKRVGWEGLFTGAFELTGLGLTAAIVFGWVIGMISRPKD